MSVCWDPRGSAARPALGSSNAAAGMAAGTTPRLVARTRKIHSVFLVFLLCMTETAIAFTILFDCSLCPCGGTTMRWLDPLYVSSRANHNIHVERGTMAYILFDERARVWKGGPMALREGCIDIPFDRCLLSWWSSLRKFRSAPSGENSDTPKDFFCIGRRIPTRYGWEWTKKEKT
ncbi:hypothetical protein F5B17DRAFT_127493 [Nemania serpens]|nr:hypothetical protein F5B17DRAFT_127493 [Nemania serpens]